MKKLYLSPNYSVLMAILSGITCVYIATLFLQIMTYKKQAIKVANDTYVSEVTRWPGHTRVNNIEIEYE